MRRRLPELPAPSPSAARGIPALALLLPLQAQAGLYQREEGAWLTADVGVSGADVRFRPALAWGAGFGVLAGASLGEGGEAARFWGAGLRVRQDLQWAEGLTHTRTAAMLEVRRSLDLFGIGVHGALLAGPLFDSDADDPTRLVGATVRAAGAFRYPLAGRLGLIVRLEVGADVARPAAATLSLSVGLEQLLGLE